MKTNATNDGINWFSSPSALRQPLYRIVTSLDQVPAVERYLATFGLGVLMAETLRRDPHEDLERARRLVRAADGPFSEQIQATRDWISEEMRR